MDSFLGHCASSTSSSGCGGGRSKDLGPSFSEKMSPWLAVGCLSARRVYQRLAERLGGDPTTTSMPPGQPRRQAVLGRAGSDCDSE